MKKWEVRSFERDVDASFWLNHLQDKVAGLAVESTTALDHCITLVVSYITDEE